MGGPTIIDPFADPAEVKQQLEQPVAPCEPAATQAAEVPTVSAAAAMQTQAVAAEAVAEPAVQPQQPQQPQQPSPAYTPEPEKPKGFGSKGETSQSKPVKADYTPPPAPPAPAAPSDMKKSRGTSIKSEIAAVAQISNPTKTQLSAKLAELPPVTIMKDEKRMEKAKAGYGANNSTMFMGLDLGPITQLMYDQSINDVLINGPKNVYIERMGVLQRTDVQFSSNEDVIALSHRIVNFVGRKVDEDRPLIDARLPDGSRVNIIMAPMAIDGVSISIRKFPAKKITIDTMIQNKNLTREMGHFLELCGKNKLNIMVSGGTGSGKTTLLNAISRFIPEKERIVTIEDSAELQLQQPHVVRLETKLPDRVGQRDKEVNIRDLVRNALRMRPDRIIVGEVRSGEAFDMMQAMNTGHEGSLTTLHSNSPRDTLARLENLINMGDMHLNEKFIREQIVSAVDIIVHANRFKDGTRRVTHITELVGMEGNTITMQDLFTFQITGEDRFGNIQGNFQWENVAPRHDMLMQICKEIGVFSGMVDAIN